VNTYDKGDVVRVTGAFTNAAGAAQDPSTVRFKFKDPANTVTTYTYPTDAQLVRDSTGNYHVDVDASISGEWDYRWEGSGAVGKSAGEGKFEVAPSVF